ncbi:MAG: urease accessory protein UreD [Hyphomicrobiaceae bacterium]|nr:urease accessory protein UreD [Hyphomicrobiaceae bacterium]MCC0023381.1 urease accessory protein UreD [Hyphomicrobiaceae bacterium]
MAENVQLQRSRGEGRLRVACSEGATRIQTLYQDGSAKIRVPRLPGSELEAVLINTSGGLTGGDQLKWQIEAGQDSNLTVTTQACEKVYRALDGVADVRTRISVGRNAFVAWLPQETILFDRAALSRNLEVSLAEGARFLAVEPIILGRTGMGEEVITGHLTDQWRIFRGDRLLHAEALSIIGAFEPVRNASAGLMGAGAFATLFYAGRDVEARLAKVRSLCDQFEIAFSFWNDKLVMRLLAKNGYELRQKLVPLLRDLSKSELPRIWHS